MNEKPRIKELPEIFDANTALSYFGFSRPMVYQLLNTPATGSIQIGRRKYFHRDSFLKWLEAQRISEAGVSGD